MKKIILLFLIFSTFSCAKKIYTSDAYFDCPTTSNFKADTDKKQLIYAILNRAVVENKDIPDYGLIKDTKKIYILDTYNSAFWSDKMPESYALNPDEIPNQIGDVQFCLKSKLELQQIADKTTPFTFLTFINFKIDGDTATIGINNGWQSQSNSDLIYLSGGGYVWQFKKVNHLWEFEKILQNFQS